MLAFVLALCGVVPQDVPQRIQSLCAKSDGIARSSALGESRGGRTIHAIELSAGGDPAGRRGVLILAGADGRRPIDTELALFQCEKLIADYAAGEATTRALLDTGVVYVVPQLNPDGAALGRHGNAAELDLDRDGKHDEDPPTDVNGDGVVTWMRWKDDDGAWLLDEKDPRLVHEADTDDDERGAYSYTLESKDADGDDARGEDDAHGVWIDRTFPHRHDEFDRRTGMFPTHEPETKALADFVYARRNIVMAFVWGRDDNLLETPKVGKPKARVQNDGILEGDKKLFERAGKAYREATGREGNKRDRMDGSPWGWLYLQLGVPAFASDVWRSPKLEKEDSKDDLLLERRRLVACEAAGRGWVDWKTFEHPELGPVEIGGFVDEDETALLPVDKRDELFAAHHAFVLDAATWHPRCHIAELSSKHVAGGAFEIEAVIENDGTLPALTATGSRCRRFAEPRLVLEHGDAAIAAGRQRHRVRNLGPNGERQSFRWIVVGEAGTTVTLRLRNDPVGGDSKEVTL